MNARAIDNSALRLHELRLAEWQDGALGAVALALSVAATALCPAVAVPLLLGGVFLCLRAVTEAVRRSELLEELELDADAYVIAEVRARAARAASLKSRRALAQSIECLLNGALPGERVRAAREQLIDLAAALRDETLRLHPAAAAACERLLHDYVRSPLLNTSLPPEDVVAFVRRVRAGFVLGSPD
jgi:hypothetical protein